MPVDQENKATFAIGDVVRVTGDKARLAHRLEPGTETTIVRLPDAYAGNRHWSEAYCVAAKGWAPGLWVHVADLALVRKAGQP